MPRSLPMAEAPPFQRRPRNVIETFAFSRDAFLRIIGSVADTAQHGEPAEAVIAHLEALGRPLVMVVERHYVDRQYRDELSRYYSTCLQHVPQACARIHFFDGEGGDPLWAHPLTTDSFMALLRDAPSSPAAWKPFLDQLNDAYRGFVVVRPLPGAPIGRSVLCPFAGQAPDGAHFTTLVSYTTHLAGIELHVSGLAFQQQDWAVAACVTTAVWAALQRVTRFESAKAPSTAEIMEAAVRHSVALGRPIPSPGLTFDQVCDALHYFEFGPDRFLVQYEPAKFACLLNAYVRSGIPVILLLDGEKEEGHAMTVVGYKDGPSEFQAGDDLPYGIRNLAFSEIIVHDDRKGPYLSGELRVRRQDKRSELWLSIAMSGRDELFRVFGAAAPLHPMIRSTAGDLIYAASQIAPTIAAYFPDDELEIEVSFDRSGSYSAMLHTLPIERRSLVAFLAEAAFSRYVGIIRWWRKGSATPLFDMIWDTTDRIRAEAVWNHVSGIVTRDIADRKQILELARQNYDGPVT